MVGCGVDGGDGPAVAACVVGGDTVGDKVLPRRFPSVGAIDGTMEGVSDGIAVTTETSVGEFVVGVGTLPTMSTITGDNVGDAVGGVAVLPPTSSTGPLVPPVQQTGANSFRTL